MASTGDLRSKMGPRFGKTRPTIRHGVGKQQVEALEYANQCRGAGQLVLAERAIPSACFHPIPRAFRDAEQGSTIGVAAAPGRDETQDGLDGRRCQPLPIFIVGEILQSQPGWDVIF